MVIGMKMIKVENWKTNCYWLGYSAYGWSAVLLPSAVVPSWPSTS